MGAIGAAIGGRGAQVWSYVQRGWVAMSGWAKENTVLPPWLTGRLRHPAVPFLAAVLLQVTATVIQLLLELLFPDFSLPAALNIFAVVLTALTFGGAPSLLSAFIGPLLVEYIVLPPYSPFNASNPRSMVEFTVLLMAGIAVSILASRNEASRQQALSLASRLASEQERLNTVIESVPDAITIHDTKGRFVRWNHAASAALLAGSSVNTVNELSSRFEMFDTSGQRLPVFAYPVVRALRGQVVSAIELRFRNHAGVEQDVILSAAPLHNQQGDIDGAVTVSHDVTTLRAIEREAARRAAQLEATFATMVDGVLVFDVTQQVLHLNTALHRLLGLDAVPDIASWPVAEQNRLLAPYDKNGTELPKEVWPLERVLRGETLTGADTMDVWMRALDGHEIRFEVSGAPIRDEHGGTIRGGLLVFRDVTERRNLEQRTHEALSALLRLAETMVASPREMQANEVRGYRAHASEESLTYSGSAQVAAHHVATVACQVLGCSRAAIIAVDPESAQLRAVAVFGLSPEDEMRWWEQQRRMEREGVRLDDGGTPEEIERFRAGEVFILDMTQSPYDRMPNPTHSTTQLVAPMRVEDTLVGVLSLDFGGPPHEFTPDEMALAGGLARFGAYVLERERLLRERTRAVDEIAILQEANRRMDRFVSIAGHELRTPLTTSKVNLQLALRQLDQMLGALGDAIQASILAADLHVSNPLHKGFADLHTMLKRMEAAEVRQERLINDMLDVSRIGAGKLELVLAPCDLVALTQDAVQEQRLAHSGRKITMSLPSEPVMIHADSGRITQVITNYLTNALKYSPSECPVAVRLERHVDCARVEVEDQGMGIPPEHLDHMWKIFHRVPGIEVQSGSGVGLGLGLHIARELVERHGGRVGVESHLGEGSTFWFAIPVLGAAPEGVG